MAGRALELEGHHHPLARHDVVAHAAEGVLVAVWSTWMTRHGPPVIGSHRSTFEDSSAGPPHAPDLDVDLGVGILSVWQT